MNSAHAQACFSGRPAVRRRASSTAGTLAILATVGGVAATAFVVTPRYLVASDETVPEVTAARVPAHQVTIDTLAAYVARSREVLAVHQRGESPFLEVVLWVDDTHNKGEIDIDEVAVISHSAILHTICLYERRRPEDESESPMLPASDIQSPAFCDAWRSRPDVTRRVLATRVSGMTIEDVHSNDDGRAVKMMALTWSPESADGPDEASVLLDVICRPRPAANRRI